MAEPWCRCGCHDGILFHILGRPCSCRSVEVHPLLGHNTDWPRTLPQGANGSQDGGS